MTATTLPNCEAEEAPSPEGLIRVTFVYANGAGTSAYFDPATLPEAMQEMSRLKDVRGRTFRTKAQTIEGWGKLRELAIDNRLKDPQGAMLLLLWAYCNGPAAKMRIAARLQETLDRDGMVCLMVVRHDIGTTVALIGVRFDSSAYLLGSRTLPPGMMVGLVPNDGAGTA